MKRPGALAVIGVTLLVAAAGCARWSMRPGAPVVPHLVRVDEGLYLGGQPTRDGVRELARLGRNRAGVMVAVYRIVHDGWPPERAYAEGCRLGMVSWNLLSRHTILRRVPRAFAAMTPLASASEAAP